MALKKKSILLIMAFLIGCDLCACGKEDSVVGESLVEDTEEVSSTEKIKNAEEEAAVQWEKGYDLPVDEQEREEAETDCKKLMELYLDIYETADKGIASNVVLDNQTVLEMQKKIKDAGYPIATMVTYSTIENYESVDSFLKECMEGKRGSVVIYEIHNDGGLGRMKFIFDGTDMYVVSTRGIRNADNKLGISYISYTRLKEWKYTEKGWFCYELCVPEPPEVSEIVDGSCLIRIKPMTEEQREMSERCVRGLGYQGNNLLCSNWNIENLNELQRKPELSESPTAQNDEPAQVSENKLSYEAQKELNKKLRKLEKQVSDCEKEIEVLEKKIAVVEEQMTTPEGASDMSLYEQHQQLKKQMNMVVEEWENTSMELEELQNTN